MTSTATILKMNMWNTDDRISCCGDRPAFDGNQCKLHKRWKKRVRKSGNEYKFQRAFWFVCHITIHHIHRQLWSSKASVMNNNLIRNNRSFPVWLKSMTQTRQMDTHRHIMVALTWNYSHRQTRKTDRWDSLFLLCKLVWHKSSVLKKKFSVRQTSWRIFRRLKAFHHYCT